MTEDISITAEVRALCANGEAKRIRESARLSRSELGRLVGTTGATVSRWEDGERRPHGARAVAYFQALRKLRQIAEKVPS